MTTAETVAHLHAALLWDVRLLTGLIAFCTIILIVAIVHTRGGPK